ncbi:MAG: NYN domain-containing protein [Defluviitaleaceae bacterium]|nr:NYN domain-containing protein [Defluviitaleaceae bacterium]
MKTAIFYDLENITLVTKQGKFEKAFIALQDKIKSSELVSEIILQKAYIRKTPRAEIKLDQMEPVMKKYNVDLVVVESLSNKTKNMVDFKMGIDATEVIVRRRSIQTVAIVSSDGDFGFLCQQIKNMGKNLLVISKFSITGDALIKLCDDLIDFSDEQMKPSFMNKILDLRITKKNFAKEEPLSALNSFLSAMKEDDLTCRLMTRLGIDFSVFVSILQNRNINLPKYNKFGFPNVMSYMIFLLNNTGFEYKDNRVFYTGRTSPLSQSDLIENVINMPQGFSYEKLLQYYEVLTAVKNINEFTNYMNFMKRIGILKWNSLRPKRDMQNTISEYLQTLQEKSGLILEKGAVKKIEEKFSKTPKAARRKRSRVVDSKFARRVRAKS